MAALTARLKRVFFDADKVRKHLDRKTRKVLSKLGAYIRQSAKSSIRYGKKPASPGRPPVARRLAKFTRKFTSRKTGEVKSRPTSPLRELIEFHYDEARRSVVAGPMAFRGSRVGAGVAPRALEYGGVSRAVSRGKVKTVTIRPHPFMRPARDKNLGILKELKG